MKIGQDMIFSLIFEIVSPPIISGESFRFRIIRKMPRKLSGHDSLCIRF